MKQNGRFSRIDYIEVFLWQNKNNKEKFENDFMFKLSDNEFKEILRLKNSTANKSLSKRRSLPYAFTEQGIYMLMTVLRGDLAVQQSKALIKLFKQMKDYIVEVQPLAFNTNSYIESRFASYDKRFEIVEGKLNLVMDNFINPSTYKEFLILNGKRVESDIAYHTIYAMAKESIILIDDYIDIRTLRLLKACKTGIKITICSDNQSKDHITNGDLNDFMIDKGIDIKVVSSKGIFHDRYVVIDYNTDNEIIYHAGASSKDVGDKISAIMQIEKTENYHHIIDEIIN